MSESRTEKAVPAGNPDGCLEGASAGGATRDQGARNAAKGGDYGPIGRHQARLDPSLPVGTGGPWQAWAGKAGRGKDDARFGTCPFATPCSASGRQGEDGLPGPTSWPLWRCERTGDQGGAKRQRARTFANVRRLLCSLALLGRSDRGAAARRSPVGIASAAGALCSHKAGCTCLEVMCIARRRGASSARHLAAAGARSLATLVDIRRHTRSSSALLERLQQPCWRARSRPVRGPLPDAGRRGLPAPRHNANSPKFVLLAAHSCWPSSWRAPSASLSARRWAWRATTGAKL